MNEDYKGVCVGVEVRLGEHLPASSLVTTVILLEEIRQRDPKAFASAVRAIQEFEGEDKR